MIKAIYNSGDLRRYVQRYESNIQKAIVAMLQRRGEQFVSEARQESTYNDRTGNLRSSLGYFIYYGKTAIEKNLRGKSKGISAASEVVQELPKKKGIYYLIGVAGMSYAASVESKGYNVITNQSIKIIPLIEGDLNKLKSKI